MNTAEGEDRRNNGITDVGTAGTTQLPNDDVTADRGWKRWSTGDLLSPDRSHAETCFAFGGARIKSRRTCWNARHPGVSDPDLYYFVLERQIREFELEKLRQQRQFGEWKQQTEEERRSAKAHVPRAAVEEWQHLEEIRRRTDEERQSAEAGARQAADKEKRELLLAREQLEEDKDALMEEREE